MFLNFHMPTNTSKASFFLFDLIMFLWYVSVKQSLQKIFLLPLWLFSWFVLYFFESFLFLIQYPNRYWDFLALSVCGKMAVFYVTFLNVVFVYVCILFFPNWLSYSSAKLLLYSSKLTPNKLNQQFRNVIQKLKFSVMGYIAVTSIYPYLEILEIIWILALSCNR